MHINFLSSKIEKRCGDDFRIFKSFKQTHLFGKMTDDSMKHDAHFSIQSVFVCKHISGSHINACFEIILNN